MVIVLGEARAAVAVDGEVIVGPSGRLVSPSGSCRSLRVEGSVEGDWRVIEAAEVGPGGCLAGSLDTRSLLFSSKAIIKGRLGVSVRSSNTD